MKRFVKMNALSIQSFLIAIGTMGQDGSGQIEFANRISLHLSIMMMTMTMAISLMITFVMMMTWWQDDYDNGDGDNDDGWRRCWRYWRSMIMTMISMMTMLTMITMIMMVVALVLIAVRLRWSVSLEGQSVLFSGSCLAVSTIIIIFICNTHMIIIMMMITKNKMQKMRKRVILSLNKTILERRFFWVCNFFENKL